VKVILLWCVLSSCRPTGSFKGSGMVLPVAKAMEAGSNNPEGENKFD